MRPDKCPSCGTKFVRRKDPESTEPQFTVWRSTDGESGDHWNCGACKHIWPYDEETQGKVTPAMVRVAAIRERAAKRALLKVAIAKQRRRADAP